VNLATLDYREQGFLTGSLAARGGLPPKTFPEGRVCRSRGCATVLSRYNARTYCWLHEPAHRFALRAKSTTRTAA